MNTVTGTLQRTNHGSHPCHDSSIPPRSCGGPMGFPCRIRTSQTPRTNSSSNISETLPTTINDHTIDSRDIDPGVVSARIHLGRFGDRSYRDNVSPRRPEPVGNGPFKNRIKNLTNPAKNKITGSENLGNLSSLGKIGRIIGDHPNASIPAAGNSGIVFWPEIPGETHCRWLSFLVRVNASRRSRTTQRHPGGGTGSQRSTPDPPTKRRERIR